MSKEIAPASRRSFMVLLPLIVALAGFGLFFWSLTHGGGSQDVPSALLGRPAPEFTLPPLAGSSKPGLKRADLIGDKVTLVNVWASWCAPCRQEHPVLMELGRDPALRLVGLNYKDTAENALRYLGALGDPYAANGYDGDGRAGLEWGVYGQPETFVVSPKGLVTYKFIGPITPETLEARLRPEIDKARTR